VLFLNTERYRRGAQGNRKIELGMMGFTYMIYLFAIQYDPHETVEFA